ncbi:MAG: class B sortase [Oscillospiraceae bacterium]|nr:class B sortase [Oscillospiraceae bacterium]
MDINVKKKNDKQKVDIKPKPTAEVTVVEQSDSAYISAVLPQKLQTIVLIASIFVLLICGIIILAVTVNKRKMPEVPQRAMIGSTVINLGGFPELPVMDYADLGSSTDILSQWEELHERNNHFVGWLKLGETVIDYPVMQYLEEEFDKTESDGYTGNSYYLKLDFDRRYDDKGSLFVDWHTPIVSKKRPDNTVIYGHNMSSGLKFHHLINYFTEPGGKDLTAYYENPTIDFTTVYDDERSTYKIFGAMYVNTDASHGEVFNYFQRRFFNSKAEFYDFIGNVMDRSVFYTDVDVDYGDEILTLSTCFFPLGRSIDTRVVVLARRVRAGEEPEVDTSVAYINPDPLYFDYYYRVQGGEWGGRNWDTSKVKGFDDFINN